MQLLSFPTTSGKGACRWSGREAPAEPATYLLGAVAPPAMFGLSHRTRSGPHETFAVDRAKGVHDLTSKIILEDSHGSASYNETRLEGTGRHSRGDSQAARARSRRTVRRGGGGRRGRAQGAEGAEDERLQAAPEARRSVRPGCRTPARGHRAGDSRGP